LEKVDNNINIFNYYDLIKYVPFYLLILLHLLGGPLAYFAIISSSIYTFYYLTFYKKIDLYVIFLLLFVGVCIGMNSEDSSIALNVPIYNKFINVLLIGPVALSTKLAACLAIPFRLVLTFKRNNEKYKIYIWYLMLFFSIIGLFLAFFSGSQNNSGLTVGFRIVLSLGVIVLPSFNLTLAEFNNQFNKILLTSAILLAFKLMNAHWLFITFGLLPLMWVRFKGFKYKIFIIACLLNLIISLDTTITIAIILILSSTFIFLTSIKIINLKNLIFLKHILIYVPLLITFYVILLPSDKLGYNFETISGYARFKLIGDRKPIWDASVSVIKSQNYFIPKSGSSLEVYFDYINTWKLWDEGSHNIFLEIGRQSGLFTMFGCSFFMVFILNRFLKTIKNTHDIYFALSFLSIYIMFGLSGQSLVYDGVGFMFWLLIAQFTKIKENESITHIIS
jgi:hypothetical protein